ncbi:MAG: beta-fructosidase [Candidatus Thorarchaeota archaeon]
MYPLVQNPDRFTWDFWYYHDARENRFHLLYLNADKSLVLSNQHHFSARIGYAVTKDFQEIEWINNDVFHADENGWDNTSIWSGDVIRIKDGFLFYYTSRDKNVDDGHTQNVGIAFSEDMIHWDRIKGFQLKPDERFYEPRSLEGDTSIHAWRDPFLFLEKNNLFMILSAKTRGAPLSKNGSIALLKSKNNSLTDWEVLRPAFSPGWFSECEVSQLYLRDRKHVLVYSCASRHDHRPVKEQVGGLFGIEGTPIEGGFSGNPEVLLPESSGVYACRVIPELNGDIVGFDITEGGFRRVAAGTDMKPVNRDFSGLSLQE